MSNESCPLEQVSYDETTADVIRFWLVVVVGGCICYAGIGFNIYLLRVLLRLQPRCPSQFTYLGYLAVFDITVALCQLLLHCVYSLAIEMNKSAPGLALLVMRAWWTYYIWVFVLSRIVTLCSACIMIVASMERLLITYRWSGPLGCWERNRHLLCAIAFGFAAAVNSSLYFEFTLSPVPHCEGGIFAYQVELNDAFLLTHQFYAEYWKFYGRSCASVLLPFTALLAINYAIITKLKQQSILVINLSSKKRAVRQASMLMLCIVLTYFVVNSLHVVTTLVEFIDINLLFSLGPLYIYLSDFISLLTVTACGSRLFVYLKFNQQIRETVCRQFGISVRKCTTSEVPQPYTHGSSKRQQQPQLMVGLFNIANGQAQTRRDSNKLTVSDNGNCSTVLTTNGHVSQGAKST